MRYLVCLLEQRVEGEEKSMVHSIHGASFYSDAEGMQGMKARWMAFTGHTSNMPHHHQPPRLMLKPQAPYSLTGSLSGSNHQSMRDIRIWRSVRLLSVC
jgi:hypothetical protein